MKPIGGAAVVTLDNPIGNVRGYADLSIVSNGCLQDQTICLGGIHGGLNYDALAKGNQNFTIKITNNNISEAKDGLIYVGERDKPGLAQQAEIMLTRVGDKYTVIGIGRGIEDEEHIFQRLTGERIEKLKEILTSFKPICERPIPLIYMEPIRTKRILTFPNEPKPLSLEATEEDLEDITIISSEGHRSKSSHIPLANKLKMQDSALEHHPDPAKDRGNLRHKFYIYIENRTFMSYCYLLLEHARGFHPLAGAMLSAAFKFCLPDKDEEKKREESLGGFFDLVLRELSLLQRYHAQETDLTPSHNDLEKLLKNQASLVAIKSRLEDIEVLLKEATGKPLKDLKTDKQALLMQKKQLEEEISPVVDKSKLSIQQEELIPDDQKKERELVKQPNKLRAFMEARYKEELVREAEESEAEKQAMAWYRLAQYHLWGWGCAQDFGKAMSYLEKAALSGKCPKAYEMIGHLHASGIGTPQRKEEAIKAYEEFAKADSDGYLHLAHFEHIKRTVMGQQQTLIYLKKAEKESNPIALRALAIMNEEMSEFDTFKEYIKHLKTMYKKLVQAEQKAMPENMVSKLEEGELSVLPALGKHYYFGRGGVKQNDFLAALCYALNNVAQDPDVLRVLVDEDPSVSGSSQGQEELAQEKLKQHAEKDNCSTFIRTLISVDMAKRIQALKNSAEEETDFSRQISETEGFENFIRKLCVMFDVELDKNIIQQLKSKVTNLAAAGKVKEGFQELVQKLIPFIESSGKPKRIQALENLDGVDINFSCQLSQPEGFNSFLRELCVVLCIKSDKSSLQQLKSRVIDLVIAEEVKERFKKLVQKLVPFIASSGQNREKYEDSLKQLEKLANKKILKITGSTTFDSDTYWKLVDNSRKKESKDHRQAIGHCFMWRWLLPNYNYTLYNEKLAATVFSYAAKKKLNYNEWGPLWRWIEEYGNSQKSEVELKENDNWLQPDNRFRTIRMKFPYKIGKLDALAQLAALGYPVGFYELGKTTMKDAPTMAFEFLGKIEGDPKAMSKLAKLYFTVEGIDGTSKKKRKEDRIEAFVLWDRAAHQGNPEAQFYSGNCYLRGWGTKVDKDLGQQRLNQAYENGYRPNDKTIECFKNPINPFNFGS